jgi:hypothetical protein
VLFHASTTDAAALENALRHAWPGGLITNEWHITGIFDGYHRVAWLLSPAALGTNEKTHYPARTREDLESMASIVDALPIANADMEAERQENNTKDENSKTNNPAQQSQPTLSFLLADGPRTGRVPTQRTKLRRIGDFFLARNAWHHTHGIPFSLAGDIRHEDIITVAGWCQQIDPCDPMGLRDRVLSADVQCLGYSGAGGWPHLCLENTFWILLDGEESTFPRVSYRLRKLTWADPSPLSGYWECGIRFDHRLQPIMVIWGSVDSLRPKDAAPMIRRDAEKVLAAQFPQPTPGAIF